MSIKAVGNIGFAGLGQSHDVRGGKIEACVMRRHQWVSRDGIAQLIDTLDPARDDRVWIERARDRWRLASEGNRIRYRDRSHRHRFDGLDGCVGMRL